MKKVFLAALLLAAAPAMPQENLKSVWDGVYTAEQAQRGRPLYAESCASCHGDRLTGGETAPPLAGGAFLSNWNGLKADELFERIRKTMPQDKPGKLPRQSIADMMAFMFQVNEFPAGKDELSTKPEMLGQIRIDGTKPAGKK